MAAPGKSRILKSSPNQEYLDDVEFDHLAALVVVPDPAGPKPGVDLGFHDRVLGDLNLKGGNGRGRGKEDRGQRKENENENEKVGWVGEGGWRGRIRARDRREIMQMRANANENVRER